MPVDHDNLRSSSFDADIDVVARDGGLIVTATEAHALFLAPVMIALDGYLLAAATLLTNRARPVVDVAQ